MPGDIFPGFRYSPYRRDSIVQLLALPQLRSALKKKNVVENPIPFFSFPPPSSVLFSPSGLAVVRTTAPDQSLPRWPWTTALGGRAGYLR